MTGEDCSQPPEGVAEIMLPWRSMTSICTVSPRRALRAASGVTGALPRCAPGSRCAMVGSRVSTLAALPPPLASAAKVLRICSSKPGSTPGRSSREAVSVTCWRLADA